MHQETGDSNGQHVRFADLEEARSNDRWVRKKSNARSRLTEAARMK
jgi:hypothetical protein